MKLITRDTDYAVRALVYMADDPDRVTTVQELVEQLDMPMAFSRRILQKLSQKGIVASFKGKGGGFCIKKPLTQVQLFELMEAFQGRLSVGSCLFKKKLCPNTRVCPLRRKMKRVEQNVFSELRAITIASLVKGPGYARPPARKAGIARTVP